MFADLAVVRQEMELRQMNERSRQRNQEIQVQEKAKLKKEWDKNYEVTNRLTTDFPHQFEK